MSTRADKSSAETVVYGKPIRETLINIWALLGDFGFENLLDLVLLSAQENCVSKTLQSMRNKCACRPLVTLIVFFCKTWRMVEPCLVIKW